MLYDRNWDTNFKAAEALGLTEVERTSLIDVLRLMESGEISDTKLYMGSFFRGQNYPSKKVISGETPCGTAACLAGWAHIVSHGEAFPELDRMHNESAHSEAQSFTNRMTVELSKLFALNDHARYYGTSAPSVDEVAPVLRNFLTTGKCKP